MNAADHLGLYWEGWSKGDLETILRAVSDDYTFDDPNAGTISKEDLSDYLSGMKETVKALRGGSLPEPFLELSEVVTQENEGIVTAWGWWVVPGTEIKGSCLIKVDSEGVRSETLAYYTKLSG
jgi:hypothetical protein